MARLPYVAPDGDVTERIRQRRGGKLTALDGVLLHSPPFAGGWNGMLGAVRGASTLPADIRELAILRVASRNGAEYEWAAHEPLARQAGLGDEQIAAIRVGGAAAGNAEAAGSGTAAGNAEAAGSGAAVLSPAQRAALAYADAMTVHVTVPDVVFGAVREHFGERQVLELTVTVAAYNMVSRVLVALDVRAGEDPFGAGQGLPSLPWVPRFPRLRQMACCSCTPILVPSRQPSSTTGTTTSMARPGLPCRASRPDTGSGRLTARRRRGWPTTR
jgi:4-carboxymuconolactone decarboxylase